MIYNLMIYTYTYIFIYTYFFPRVYVVRLWLTQDGETTYLWAIQDDTAADPASTRVPLPTWMSQVLEMRVCKFAAEHDKWQNVIDKRASLGRGLTKSQSQSHELWQANLIQKMIFNKKRNAYVGDARLVNKDCIGIQLHLSENPEQLLLSTGGENTSNTKEFRLLLLKRHAQEVPTTIPEVLDTSCHASFLGDAHAEGGDDVGKSDEQDDPEHDMSEQQIQELHDQRMQVDDADDDGFVMLADSDDDDDDDYDLAIPKGLEVSRVKSFFRREAWKLLENKGLTDLPRHVKGCSIGYHQGTRQWQGFYPNATCVLSCFWGGTSNRSEPEAILRAIRGILQSHTNCYPKDKVWARQLQKVKDAEATKLY